MATDYAARKRGRQARIERNEAFKEAQAFMMAQRTRIRGRLQDMEMRILAERSDTEFRRTGMLGKPMFNSGYEVERKA